MAGFATGFTKFLAASMMGGNSATQSVKMMGR
jgi:hypothetical protein